MTPQPAPRSAAPANDPLTVRNPAGDMEKRPIATRITPSKGYAGANTSNKWRSAFFLMLLGGVTAAAYNAIAPATIPRPTQAVSSTGAGASLPVRERLGEITQKAPVNNDVQPQSVPVAAARAVAPSTVETESSRLRPKVMHASSESRTASSSGSSTAAASQASDEEGAARQTLAPPSPASPVRADTTECSTASQALGLCTSASR